MVSLRNADHPDSMTSAVEGRGRRIVRCMRCGDVIGVYEPLVHVPARDGARRTSQAAEPHVKDEPGGLYHEGCYERLRAYPQNA